MMDAGEQGSRGAGARLSPLLPRPAAPLRVEGSALIDALDRAVLLRGVNLGGNSKTPVVPDGRTHRATDFSDHRRVSFVGRPFPLREADEHYGRLRHWGFNCLRFLVTWEALEHAGPGEYDVDYIDYLAEVVARAADYDLTVFIDPHQDVWSRMSGGDGAPGWTLEVAGFDVTKLDASEAALTMQRRYPDYGTMVWSGNRRRLASGTMFTLFFAGELLAPECRVGGESIQGYLQRHYCAAVAQVAGRLCGMPHVIGYDTMNEPDAGYIGLARLSDVRPLTNAGPLMTGFESLIVPAGFTRTVPLQARRGAELVTNGMVTLNPGRLSAWRDPALDVWRRHGVWDVDGRGEPVLLRDDYFAGVDFVRDGLSPFVARFAAAVRAHDADAILFVEGRPNAAESLPAAPGPAVYAAHWYDSLTTRSKHYDPARAIDPESGVLIGGENAVRAAYVEQIGRHVARARAQAPDEWPVLLGEFGLPFDLDGRAAYATADYNAHIAALSAYYDALDAHLLHGTLWNYTPDNENTWGDGWNGEDYSIFSRDQREDPADRDSGGRAVAGFCRPYVLACAGRPRAQRFDVRTGRYSLEIDADATGNATLIYVPRRHYPGGPRVAVSGGRVAAAGEQLLAWTNQVAGPQTLTLEPLPGATENE